MKAGILGAGISGLSIGRLLSDVFEVQILERRPVAGGIARTRTINNATYHLTGGHCFNSRYKEVLDFVFKEVLPESEWHKVTRNAVIRFKGHEIDYPIEFAIKQIHAFDPALAINITKDFLNAEDEGVYKNLEDWFRKKFGNTLADEYFLPYNAKIWNNDPARMDPSWVEGKLPIPDKISFFNGLIGTSTDKMPHSEFYYPNSNNQNTFIESLAWGLDIRYDFDVSTISYSNQSKKWTINDSVEFDLLISTLPLNIIPRLVSDCPEDVLAAAGKLRYNKVSNVLWETRPTDRTWTYIPDKDNIFHRYIHIGNFFRPVQNYTITEVVGERTYEEMVENGKKDPFLIKPLDYHISDHAYVVFDENYEDSTRTVMKYLNDTGIYTLGRFGEWQYYNMDICIKRSLELGSIIRKKYTGE